MHRMHIYMIGVALSVSAAVRIDAAPGFELRSRSLVEGPAKTAVSCERGIILGTGGGIVMLPPGGGVDNGAFLPLEGEPQNIAVLNGTAYIAANRGGLIAVDISDPGAPRAVFQGRAKLAARCAVARNYLFVAGYHKDVYTFDLEEPHKPQLVEKSTLKEPAVFLASENDLLVVASARQAAVYRVQDDGRLKRVAAVSSSSPIAKGMLGGNILYLVTKTREVLRWSLQSPGEPRMLKPLSVKGVIDCALDGGQGMLLTDSGEVLPFRVKREASDASNVEIGSPLNLITEKNEGETRSPGLLTRIFRSKKRKEFEGTSLVIHNDGFATIGARTGLSLFRREGGTARLLGNISTGGFAIDLVASDDILYVANGHDGLRIGRVGREGSVDWIGHLQSSEARDVTLSKGTIILSDGHSGVKLVDVTDPCNPRIVGKHDSPFYQCAVETDGERAYLAGGMGGAEIIDYKDPTRPKLLWRQEFSEVRGIDVEGRYLYVADGYEGLRIFSLDGEKPSPLSVLDTSGWNCDVYVVGTTAYIADGGWGVKIIDVTDARQPKLLGSVNVNSIVREIHALEGMVFAAAHTKGIAAIDVSRPDAPVVADMFPTVDDGRGVFADRRFVYLASGSGGVYIFTFTR